MAKKKADLPQINFRVDPATMDILEAVIFIDRLRGMRELLLPVVEEFAAGQEKRAEVKAAVVARREAGAQATGKLERLPRKNRTIESS